mmetsp:Transcript_22114/g.72820  ORF Transcript_22114/g.72820 Transcript_22114/m.72820 type:complete len:113 (-) Transcript_22114:922-1260(-)
MMSFPDSEDLRMRTIRSAWSLACAVAPVAHAAAGCVPAAVPVAAAPSDDEAVAAVSQRLAFLHDHYLDRQMCPSEGETRHSDHHLMTNSGELTDFHYFDACLLHLTTMSWLL